MYLWIWIQFRCLVCLLRQKCYHKRLKINKCKKRLALGNQGFPFRVRSLAICRGELSAVIVRLISKCFWSWWKWLGGVRISLLPYSLWMFSERLTKNQQKLNTSPTWILKSLPKIFVPGLLLSYSQSLRRVT